MRIQTIGSRTLLAFAAGTAVLASLPLAGPAYAWNVSTNQASVSKVHINGHGSDVTVQPGAAVVVTLNYEVWNIAPSAIDQLEIGFANANPAGCFYNGIPSMSGTKGSASYTLTAPTTPGSYFIAFDRALDYDCLYSSSGWWTGTPSPQNQYLGHITVR